MSREPRYATEKLVCPQCGCAFSKVVPRNLTQGQDHAAYRRHRKCVDCGCEYETAEIVTNIFKATTSSVTNPAA